MSPEAAARRPIDDLFLAAGHFRALLIALLGNTSERSRRRILTTPTRTFRLPGCTVLR